MGTIGRPLRLAVWAVHGYTFWGDQAPWKKSSSGFDSMLPPEEQRVTSDVSSSGSHPEPSGDIMQLILAAQAGDEAALGFLMQHCRDYLMLIANEEQDRVAGEVWRIGLCPADTSGSL